jgi:periplasmic copper chaperone A
LGSEGSNSDGISPRLDSGGCTRPDGYRDTFVLSLTIPDTPGETIYFPTIQTCEQGETAWIEIPAEGDDPEALEEPAPAATVVEAAEGSEPGNGH